MSNIQQLSDRIERLEKETKEDLQNRVAGNDKAKKENGAKDKE